MIHRKTNRQMHRLCNLIIDSFFLNLNQTVQKAKETMEPGKEFVQTALTVSTPQHQGWFVMPARAIKTLEERLEAQIHRRVMVRIGLCVHESRLRFCSRNNTKMSIKIYWQINIFLLLISMYF